MTSEPMSAAVPEKTAALPLIISAVLLVVVVVASFRMGRFPVTSHDVFAVVWAKISGGTASVEPVVQAVILNVRLPRVIAGILVGGALSVAGATYQGMFRNPLVSPDILGVSAGAGVGAVLGIFLGWSVLAIQGAAFLTGLAAVAGVYGLAMTMRHQERTLVLVLTGVAVATLLEAALSVMQLLADPYTQLPTITYWLMGSLNAASPEDVMVAGPAILLGLIPLWILRWRMNLLCLGDEEAQALGIQTTVFRAIFIVSATLMTAAAVAISGAHGWRGLGWVGLIIPHIARLLVGPDFTRLLPISLMLGAAFIVAMDSLARSMGVTEIPLGILTSVVGVPFFLWLLTSMRRVW
ncbi:iron ABC transporter permease [Telmatospirillum sp.]|uniref:FecCD family ABC transporter permease n=1 Tax=Telmatospirillum sp. TaxID=2079197 RepID=UPI00283C2B6B|nr:iron ABC transporter permease [Telmatospirillum sp.]MDR3435847.1 iron ABC transporter permease [Telmatospirillum sp.]